MKVTENTNLYSPDGNRNLKQNLNICMLSLRETLVELTLCVKHNFRHPSHPRKILITPLSRGTLRCYYCVTEISEVGAGRCSTDIVKFVHEYFYYYYQPIYECYSRISQGNFRGLAETIKLSSERHGHSYFRGRTRFTPDSAGPKSYFRALTQQVQ